MTRPANFTGFTGVISGAAKNSILAVDWNAFNQRLIAFALFKNVGDQVGTFVTVGTGNIVSAPIFNRTVEALNVLDSFISPTIPSQVISGQHLYASYIQALKTALNSIT